MPLDSVRSHLTADFLCTIKTTFIPIQTRTNFAIDVGFVKLDLSYKFQKVGDMTPKPTQNHAPMFYKSPNTHKNTAWLQKARLWFREKRIQHLQQRIEAIQEALRYELQQNHPIGHQQALVARAKHMQSHLLHKQQRLLQKI